MAGLLDNERINMSTIKLRIGMNTIKLSETKHSIKTITYTDDGTGGNYAVIRCIRKSDGKVFRTRIIHGA